jgi:Subtilase family/Secretion system C-terminal sorting domain
MNKNFVSLRSLNRFEIDSILKNTQLLLFASPNNMGHLKKCLCYIVLCCCCSCITIAQETTINKQVQKYSATQSSFPFYIINIHEEIPKNNYIVVRALDENNMIVKFHHIESTIGKKIQPVNDLWKYAPSVAKATIKKGQQQFIITTNDITTLLIDINKLKKEFKINGINNDTKSLLITCSFSFLQKNILQHTSVIFIDQYEAPQMEQLISGYDRSLHQLNAVDYLYPSSNGKNIVVGIKEKNIEDNDIDIQKRIEPSILAATQKDNHATSMATLIGGAGNSFYTGKGLAWNSIFFPSTFANLFADSSALLTQKNITIQNHSYGTIPQAYYGAEAMSYDKQTWENKNIIHIFSSGNRGLETPTQGTYSGIATYANVTGNFKMAKNIITVGAVDTGNMLAPFSSSGPTYDGRLAPQVVALGPNGTSDAAAIVSGLAAILQQEYKDKSSQIAPPASLIKAVLCNTADDIGNKGIDYKSGYGSINAFTALQSIKNNKFDGGTVIQNQTWTKLITVPTNAANLKITMAYTDTTATVNTFKTIVNDLDIELQEMTTGVIYKPWCLSSFPHKDSLVKLPVRRKDSLNTTEQISIDLPNAGQYNIRVVGTKINTTTSQAFHVAYNWDTLNIFTFINPIQAADVNREENPTLTIKWKTRVADTNTVGSFFISYNNGATWQPVANNIKIYKQQCYWTIKDTNSIAKIKVEVPFGTFFTNNFILSKLTKIKVDYLCTDSFQLSWNKHVYANSYKLFALPDSAYLRPLTLVITDTFISLKKANYPYSFYAVQPILNNNLVAARSAALDINLQGVNCFYSSFIGTGNSNFINLDFELSITKNIDSVVFEKVNSDGSIIKQVQKRTVINGQNNYSAIDNQIFTGNNNYRVKMYFKNGTFIYSNTISIISAGEKNILLYPNPAKRTAPIQYILKNTIDHYKLDIIDMQGSVISRYNINISGSITIPKAASGMYIYKLTDANNNKIETGKLLIEN